jgi:hypothetical protein
MCENLDRTITEQNRQYYLFLYEGFLTDNSNSAMIPLPRWASPERET